MTFSPRVVHTVAAPHFHQSLVDPLLVNAKLLEHISGVALGFQSSGDEEMLGPYVVVLQPFRFLLGVVQQAGRPGGGVDLIGLAG